MRSKLFVQTTGVGRREVQILTITMAILGKKHLHAQCAKPLNAEVLRPLRELGACPPRKILKIRCQNMPFAAKYYNVNTMIFRMSFEFMQ